MRTANENVLRALAKATADARAGNVGAVAIITVTPDGVPDVTFGGDSELIPSANLGADLFKASLMQQAMVKQALPTTSIVRPATGELDS